MTNVQTHSGTTAMRGAPLVVASIATRETPRNAQTHISFYDFSLELVRNRKAIPQPVTKLYIKRLPKEMIFEI